MRNRIYHYTPLTVHHIARAPHERFTFAATSAATCIGTIYASGVIAPLDADSGPPIAEHRQWRPRHAWGVWRNPAAASGEARFEAGPDGAEWICLSRNGSGERSVAHHAIDGSFTLPAGWGLVVASGRVVLGGQAGEAGNYFAPRATDVELAGAGDLLLVR